MREAQTKKVSVTLILGDKERDNNLVSYRLIGSKDTTTLSYKEFISYLENRIENKD